MRVAGLTAIFVAAPLSAWAGPASFERTQAHVGSRRAAVMVIRVDLADPRTHLTLEFSHGSSRPVLRREPFPGFVERHRAAAIVNGTFFGIRNPDTMGNLVRQGGWVQRRAWDDRGTAFVLGKDRIGRLVTIRAEGWPVYSSAWLCLPAGPRLLKEGKSWLHPKAEGFGDPPLFRRMPRTALGLSRDGRTLTLAAFPDPVTLAEEARAMRALGCWDALNLDGGPSAAMSYRGKVVQSAGWNLTNALVVYDARHPAPSSVTRTWEQFAGGAGGWHSLPPHFSPWKFER